VRLIDFREPLAQAVDRYESREAAFARIAVTHGNGHLGCMYLAPGGGLGRHPAPCPQLFCVVRGEGTVTGGDGVPRAIESGQAVLFDSGEDHESSTFGGMVVLVLEVSSTIQSAAG
jgi:mannose-6-phosphate isomerase-like protein (cupin superfamily)